MLLAFSDPGLWIRDLLPGKQRVGGQQTGAPQISVVDDICGTSVVSFTNRNSCCYRGGRLQK